MEPEQPTDPAAGRGGAMDAETLDLAREGRGAEPAAYVDAGELLPKGRPA